MYHENNLFSPLRVQWLGKTLLILAIFIHTEFPAASSFGWEGLQQKAKFHETKKPHSVLNIHLPVDCCYPINGETEDKYYNKSRKKVWVTWGQVWLSLAFLVKKILKAKFTQDHCGEGGLVLALVHSCRPDASLHMYLSVGRPLWWNSARNARSFTVANLKGKGRKACL